MDMESGATPNKFGRVSPSPSPCAVGNQFPEGLQDIMNILEIQF